MSDCKCGHLICTFPDCDNGEPANPISARFPSMCKECGLILCTCDDTFAGSSYTFDERDWPSVAIH